MAEDLTITHYGKPIFLREREGNGCGQEDRSIVLEWHQLVLVEHEIDKSQRLVDYEEGVAAK